MVGTRVSVGLVVGLPIRVRHDVFARLSLHAPSQVIARSDDRVLPRVSDVARMIMRHSTDLHSDSAVKCDTAIC